MLVVDSLALSTMLISITGRAGSGDVVQLTADVDGFCRHRDHVHLPAMMTPACPDSCLLQVLACRLGSSLLCLTHMSRTNNMDNFGDISINYAT